jgi:predicted nucleotidyltransferase
VRVIYPRFSRDELVHRLQCGAKTLAQELPLVRVTLFGSWAKGRATAFSDIDVLVTYAGPTRDDAYTLVRRHVPVRGLEPHLYTEKEARQMDDVLERMTRDGIPIFSRCTSGNPM